MKIELKLQFSLPSNILENEKITYILHVVTVHRDHQRVPADRGWRPRSTITAIAVGPDQHTLAGSLDGWRHEPQFLERVILIGFHDGDGVEAHFVVDGHLVRDVQGRLWVTPKGQRVRLRNTADFPALIGLRDVRLVDRHRLDLDLQRRQIDIDLTL